MSIVTDVSLLLQVHFSVVPQLTECCNKHDYCYDTCGSVKNKCDIEFKNCIMKMCSCRNLTLSKEQSENVQNG